MKRVKIKDKEFEVSITSETILERVHAVAEEINKDMEGKTPLFLIVLNGAFMFAADLMKEITIPCELSFVKLASYEGVLSTGKVKEVIGLNVDISNRDVIIVEDIVDTGKTMHQMLATLSIRNPKSIKICSLFLKPDKLEEDVKVDYCCFSIPNDFIVGYGLDYDQLGRNLKEVYTLVQG